MISPVVVDSYRNREYVFDLYSRFLRDRIVILDTLIDDRITSIITAQLLFLDSKNSSSPIWLYINSPGGIITSGLAIYDTMQLVRAPVCTLCMGQAASMGAVLLAGGKYRAALPHARIMLHHPSGGYAGQATDITIHAEEINRLKGMLIEILSRHSGLTAERLTELMERDRFMGPEEARGLGLIDEVLG